MGRRSQLRKKEGGQRLAKGFRPRRWGGLAGWQVLAVLYFLLRLAPLGSVGAQPCQAILAVLGSFHPCGRRDLAAL